VTQLFDDMTHNDVPIETSGQGGRWEELQWLYCTATLQVLHMYCSRFPNAHASLPTPYRRSPSAFVSP
jgi:hypothetical protein